jgi:uncharacterized protein
MPLEDQREAIAFLTRPETHGAVPVERIDTHCSILVLAGDRAYKLKRAVRFSYLDYSTVALRERACRAELALNRRTAPGLYLAVSAIARAPDGSLAFDGPGEILDWVVVMRRFDEAGLFDRLADAGRLTPVLMRELADHIADFHDAAEIDRGAGGRAGMARVVAGNAENLALHAPPLDPRSVAGLIERTDRALAAVGALLDRRRAAGRVRLCHGDLHLRNICLVDGRPTLFDCIEFSRELAAIDLLYDLGFLLMDLERRGLRPLGNIVFNRYFDRTGEGGEALAALPLFLSVRAGVRAHVEATAGAAQTDRAEAAKRAAAARAYLELASALLEPAPPWLVAVGGLSGTGKSTLAQGLARDLGRAPGARLLRSDVLRKRLMGVAPETRLSPSAYAEPVTARVYAALAEEARATLAAGQSVILDAVFVRAEERAAVAALSRAAGIPFAGLWLAADPAALEARIAARGKDASDATVEVLRRQLGYDTGRIDWARIDASGDAAATLARARDAIAGGPPR